MAFRTERRTLMKKTMHPWTTCQRSLPVMVSGWKVCYAPVPFSGDCHEPMTCRRHERLPRSECVTMGGASDHTPHLNIKYRVHTLFLSLIRPSRYIMKLTQLALTSLLTSSVSAFAPPVSRQTSRALSTTTAMRANVSKLSEPASQLLDKTDVFIFDCDGVIWRVRTRVLSDKWCEGGVDS